MILVCLTLIIFALVFAVVLSTSKPKTTSQIPTEGQVVLSTSKPKTTPQIPTEGQDRRCGNLDKPPHIVLVLSDDLGWNDVGYNNERMKTPVIDALAKNGVIFDNMYSQPACTPSRAAILTGRYPANVGLQHLVIEEMQPFALPLNYTMLSVKLKELGYMNHMVGKWHLGYCNWKYTPLWRGFDSFYGVLNGFLSDYFSHITNSPFFGPKEGVGLDFRDNTGAVLHENGTHATFLFTERAQMVIEKHNPVVPLFLYLPFLLPHGPIQPPPGFEESAEGINNTLRRPYAEVMGALDEAIGNVTQTLKDKGMWDDTLFIFQSDNGGDIAFGGSNYPLRGNKATLWEGGIRVPSFAHGSMLEKTKYVNHELMHVSDWFPTLLKLAGGTPDPDLDGIDQWDTMCRGDPSKRTEILHHLDTHEATPAAALRMGDYKYFEGYFNLVPQRIVINAQHPFDDWFRPPEDPSAYVPNGTLYQENINNTFLFNIKDDEYETNNLVDDPAMQDKLQEMKDRLQYYKDNMAPLYFPDDVEESNPIYSNGVWTPGFC
ncbi:arylsulfatase B-like [Glandiceps talaboti]